MKLTHSLFISVALAASTLSSQGSMLVQELFDGITTGDASLDGKGDGTTSVGMTDTWATNGSTGIFTASNFNVNGTTLPGLPSDAGGNGGVWNNQTTYATNIYATRPLATPISFSTTQEIFFSVRLRNHADTAMGVGLADGANGSAAMIGAGFTWNTQTGLGGQNAANAAYITHGTLDQNLTGFNDGVYAAQAHETAGSVNGYGLLVGRITINAVGDDVISIKRYAENAIIDNDLSTISWSATSSVDLSMTATHLLLWMNGSNNGNVGGGELDAIRFGTSWTDVTGVTLVGPGITYADWIAGFPGAALAPGFDQDADSDGITNGIEQILGTDPSVSSGGLSQVSATGTSVTFRHTQTNLPASDLTKSYEWSTDLVEWRPTGIANSGGTIGTIVESNIMDNAAPENDMIEVVVTQTETLSSKLFVRLVVQQ